MRARLAGAVWLVLVLGGLAADGLSGQDLERLEDAQVQEAVEQVVSSSDFRHLRTERRSEGPGWLERLLEWLFGGSGGTGTGATFVGYLIVFAGLVAVVTLIVRAILMRSGERAGAKGNRARAPEPELLRPSVPPGELSMATYREKALALARAGDFRAAIGHLLLGCMSWVERAGLIRFRKGLTNYDYLRASRRRPEFQAAMVPIVRQFEEIYFGRRPATEERFHQCLEHLAQGVRDGEDEKPVA